MPVKPRVVRVPFCLLWNKEFSTASTSNYTKAWTSAEKTSNTTIMVKVK